MQVNPLLITIICLSFSSPAFSEQQEDEMPSEELLDFLGQWEKVDNEWIDPTQLQDISMLDKKDIKGEADD